jgi:hypothetical protein
MDNSFNQYTNMFNFLTKKKKLKTINCYENIYNSYCQVIYSINIVYYYHALACTHK